MLKIFIGILLAPFALAAAALTISMAIGITKGIINSLKRKK